MSQTRTSIDSSEVTLVLAAHGSPVDRRVNDDIVAVAKRLEEVGGWREVVTAFHYGEPGYSESLHRVSSKFAVVVPLMTSEGHFYERVKQTFATTARDQIDLRLVVSRAIGTHHQVAEVISKRIKSLVARFAWSSIDVGVLLIGHGSRRHSNSRTATLELAEQLNNFWQSEEATNLIKPAIAFIDDDPSIKSVAASIKQNRLVVIPFLISNGPHARVDVPAALGLGKKENASEPWLVDHNGKQLVIDLPFGSLPDIEKLITQRAQEALQSFGKEQFIVGGHHAS